jgi:hypothetical protein
MDRKELLLEDRYAPITKSMGFFESESDNVVKTFLTWKEEIKKGGNFIRKISMRIVNGGVEEALKSLMPLKMIGATRFLFIPTRHGWTAYFTNGYRGTDPSLIGYLPELMQSRSIWVVAEPHRETLTLGTEVLIMNVYGHEEGTWLNLIRSIRLENNSGKWEFKQVGQPFPFEQVERYQAKRKKDRFDFALLKAYLQVFGLFPFESDFYLPSADSKAVLVEMTTAGPVKNRDVSLEKARELNGIS